MLPKVKQEEGWKEGGIKEEGGKKGGLPKAVSTHSSQSLLPTQ